MRLPVKINTLRLIRFRRQYDLLAPDRILAKLDTKLGQLNAAKVEKNERDEENHHHSVVAGVQALVERQYSSNHIIDALKSKARSETPQSDDFEAQMAVLHIQAVKYRPKDIAMKLDVRHREAREAGHSELPLMVRLLAPSSRRDSIPPSSSLSGRVVDTKDGSIVAPISFLQDSSIWTDFGTAFEELHGADGWYKLNMATRTLYKTVEPEMSLYDVE